MLIVRNAANQIIFDTSSNCVKFRGQLMIGRDYTGAAQSGQIVDDRFTYYAQHTPFFFRSDGVFESIENDPYVSISGNVLTWQYPSAAVYVNGILTNRPNCIGIYGVE